MVYNDAGQLVSETRDGITVSNTFDHLLRRTNLTVNTGQGSFSQSYAYGAASRLTGPMASVGPLRWSTKFTDDETGNVDYGLREYEPSPGRWRSRKGAYYSRELAIDDLSRAVYQWTRRRSLRAGN